jgi:indoleamine 2,3-dioxygenase
MIKSSPPLRNIPASVYNNENSPRFRTIPFTIFWQLCNLFPKQAKVFTYAHVTLPSPLNAMSPYLTEVKENDQYTPGDALKDVFPHIEDDPITLPSSLDPFTITTSTGFLPLRPPQIYLPAKFAPLTALVEELPAVKLDGSPGLLATYKLGPAIDNDNALPDLNDEIDSLIIDDGKPDLAAVTAAFREYAFIASAYLLEPCWERWNKGLEGYGLGRQVLPKCIAGPLVKTAKM